MGKVASASSISATAYLTEIGRRYLFGKDSDGNPIRFEDDGTDNFEITEFSLFDSDRNYGVSSNFETGDMPDIAGTSDNTCLKTSANISRRNRIAYNGQIPSTGIKGTTLKYKTNPKNLTIDIDELANIN